ncbi:MAG: 2OG-Fe(II) oxygenase [Candidatus Omnitrophica bacterium]|nr:2OG-Fe(II) oxygenase [Candidatus Omnitrophota bacterium]
MNPFFFDPASLRIVAEKNRLRYAFNEPFPHIVIDDFLPAEVLEEVLGEFPKPGEIDWIHYRGKHELKLESKKEKELGLFTRHLIAQMNGSDFLNFLENLSGIKGLVSDPHLFGGGLHQIERGGHLSIHADFNWHPRLKLDRRVNLLLYLNQDWKEEYGGHLELWDRPMTRAVQRILPVFNRCVIFSSSDYSFHGHPDLLTCPSGWTRKSLALYYYTNGRPAHEKNPNKNSTHWRKRPQDNWQEEPPAPIEEPAR